MSSRFLYEGKMANGFEYGIAGRAHPGNVSTRDGVTMVGQDAVAVLPKNNTIILFDGSGGASDVGSPEEASFVATVTAHDYIQNHPDAPLTEPMDAARKAVTKNKLAGLCVGTIVQIKPSTQDNSVLIDVINAGDTISALYDLTSKSLSIIADQQMDSAGVDPTNFLGRKPKKLKSPTADFFDEKYVELSHEYGLFVMTDGAFGNWRNNKCLYYYDFAAACSGDFQFLQDAIDTMPDLENSIRKMLTKRRHQQKLSDGYVSPELINPALFSLTSIGWDTWNTVVQPYLGKHTIPRKPVTALRVAKAVLDRRICWDFEKIPPDDAVVAHVWLR